MPPIRGTIPPAQSYIHQANSSYQRVSDMNRNELSEFLRTRRLSEPAIEILNEQSFDGVSFLILDAEDIGAIPGLNRSQRERILGIITDLIRRRDPVEEARRREESRIRSRAILDSILAEKQDS